MSEGPRARDVDPGTPAWVKLVLLGFLLAAVLFLVLQLLGHGPGVHMP